MKINIDKLLKIINHCAIFHIKFVAYVNQWTSAQWFEFNSVFTKPLSTEFDTYLGHNCNESKILPNSYFHIRLITINYLTDKINLPTLFNVR